MRRGPTSFLPVACGVAMRCSTRSVVISLREATFVVARPSLSGLACCEGAGRTVVPCHYVKICPRRAGKSQRVCPRCCPSIRRRPTSFSPVARAVAARFRARRCDLAARHASFRIARASRSSVCSLQRCVLQRRVAPQCSNMSMVCAQVTNRCSDSPPPAPRCPAVRRSAKSSLCLPVAQGVVLQSRAQRCDIAARRATWRTLRASRSGLAVRDGATRVVTPRREPNSSGARAY